ncbi:MAG: excinuclease ABC subunit UvrA [Ruminococcaceae bacterium]|nr:excinuclease ABC subunit UvrA [Oscillospiraceae bacterium]
MPENIIIRGARMNNLKNIDLTIPRDKLVVMTGLSGSGKSSLAFDTLHAEGHRRFVESLSSYARMFLGQLDKPDVDSIEGLSPSISIDQKTTSKNPRSTVGTVTEIYDYLRLFYARLGIPHCPVCGKEIRQTTTDTIIDKILEYPEGERLIIASPVVRGKKGRHEKVFADARKNGFVRVRVDGIVYDLSEEIELDKNKKHNIELVIDRIIIRGDIRGRISDSVETALRESDGFVNVVRVQRDKKEEDADVVEFSTNYACVEHGISFGELEPRMFSFNNPFGACPECSGLGVLRSVSPDKIIGDNSLSLDSGAICVNGFKTLTEDSWNGPVIYEVLKPFGVDLSTPVKDYPKAAYDALLYGSPEPVTAIRVFGDRVQQQTMRYEGLVKMVSDRAQPGAFNHEYYEQFLTDTECPHCHGARLNKEATSVTIGGKNIHQFCSLSVTEALAFVNSLTFSDTEMTIAREILKELKSRLSFLASVGLEYLTLSRQAGTLSGGEAQRIRLATQIGSSLAGVLYILDEPSIGLHQRDNTKLIATLKMLRDQGNSVIVVEHDEETMLSADYLIDIGPGAGIHGGNIIACGTPAEVADNPDSLTGAYLSGRRAIPVPAMRRAGNGKTLTIVGAKEHNLKNIDVNIPLGCFVCVTGVSGSGKSSLINSILYQRLAHDLNRAITYPGAHTRIDGEEHLDKIIAIDQSPIGRTPRSNPATYTGLFNDIRDLFAKTPGAKMRGFGPGRFSFNVKGGRCEACEGDGVKKIEMHFLADVYVNCDACKGKRYNRETLEVKYKEKSISDVLDMTAEEGVAFFSEIPKIASRLQLLCDVGLGYIKIGQSSTTLSGGEAQRVKLATELSKRQTGRTIYILDEPTTGLHSADVEKLIAVLERLVEQGNSIVVIEHNLDVIKTADHIIDMGPEGGDRGGTVIAEGTPEEVACCIHSWTGRYLREKLGMEPWKDEE